MVLGLVTLAFVFYLLGYEAWAIRTGHPTIIDEVRIANKAFVMLPYIAGGITWGLAVHFLGWC